MNIILFTATGKKPIRINLNRRQRLWLAGLACMLVICIGTAGFAVGSAFSVRDRQALAELSDLAAVIDAQRADLAAMERYNQLDVNALALRLGDLQARTTRVEALGERLTELGQLDDGEFDFSVAPPIGGPLEAADHQNYGKVDLAGEILNFEHRIDYQERQLSVLERLIAGREIERNLRPAGRPIDQGWLSSGFGQRTDPFTAEPAMHYGIDFSGPASADILAVAGGVVTWSGKRPAYGLTVDIDHGNDYLTRYAHNTKNLVAVGDRIQAGQNIALMGSTGRATSPHVHFEVWYQGRRTNPTQFVRDMR